LVINAALFYANNFEKYENVVEGLKDNAVDVEKPSKIIKDIILKTII